MAYRSANLFGISVFATVSHQVMWWNKNKLIYQQIYIKDFVLYKMPIQTFVTLCKYTFSKETLRHVNTPHGEVKGGYSSCGTKTNVSQIKLQKKQTDVGAFNQTSQTS